MERRHIFRGTVNFILLLIVAIPILLFFLIGEPYQRGFNCDDDSLRYPYIDSTVHTLVLYFVGTGLPVIAIFLLEFVRTRRESVGKPVKLFGRDMNPWFWAAYCSVGTFLFGCACSQLSTDIAKYTIGRLRPHFIDICKPDWSKINCSVPYQYIFPIPCTATDAHRMKEARLSFPSGHASFSAYTMIYLVIYLQVRFRFRAPELLRPFLQFICLLLTFYTSLSRISDYKHHWSDVLSGFVLGAVVAVLIAVYFSDLFPRELPTQIKKGQEVFLQEYTGTDGHETHTARTNVAD
ncbi:Catalytic activity protein [Halocaridina rubra]|uniref:Catalytic activity protein n=1 Tax=Halocaridina rubra TaxID=373956 RepID=A0AAN8XCB7_HALRR